MDESCESLGENNALQRAENNRAATQRTSRAEAGADATLGRIVGRRDKLVRMS
jgi:hypothetical protein